MNKSLFIIFIISMPLYGMQEVSPRTMAEFLADYRQDHKGQLPQPDKYGYVNLSNQNINSLDGIHLLIALNIRKLDLSRNRIREIQNYAFRGLDQLEYLNLARNKITTISDFAFIGVPQLEVLNLAHNDLTRPTIDDSAFALVPTKKLALGGNMIAGNEQSFRDDFRIDPKVTIKWGLRGQREAPRTIGTKRPRPPKERAVKSAAKRS